MRIIALAAITPVNSLAKQLQRVLLFSALFAIGTVNSWGQLAVSPASVTFAKQLITTKSGAKVVTITNTGASAQPIVITMSGDFTETDNCSGSVAAGGSCSASLFFTPTILGSIKGAASIYDNSNNLLAFVGLSATGGAPVTAAPATLNFTGGTIGTQNTQTLTFKITNAALTPTTVNTITPSSNFTLSSTGTCLTTPLAAKTGNCTVGVQVTPTAAVNDGSIIITDNAANGLPLVVKLTSAASGGSTTPISLSKTSLTFSTLSGGTSATQTITVTNTSGSVLTLGTISASTDYAIVSNSCGSSLAIAGTCTFGLTFDPTFVGSIGGSAAVSYTGNNSPQLVYLNGTSKPPLTFAPGSLAFGSVAVGATSTVKAVKITNNSASAVTLNNVSVTGDFGIQLSGTTCVNGFSLLAGKFCTINATFSPTIAGAIVGAVTVTNTGSPNPLLIALGGTGTNTATASLNPASAHQGSSETIVITGTNTNFGPTTTVSFGANITTGTLTVNGPTSMSVPITIDNSAVVGSRTVTITTGAQVVKPSFTVIAGVPAVTLINPNTIQPTQTESVAVTGAFTNWVNGTTKANFGPGIAVGGAAAGTFGPVTVTGGTTLTASLVTSGATTGFRTVQVQTGSQTLTVNNGMDVLTCTSTPPTILSISPANGLSSVPLNAKVQVQFSVPMNRSTLSQLGNTAPATVYFWDSATNVEVPATISVDASGTIATITPTTSLAAGRTYYTYWSYGAYVQDVCGNNFGGAEYYFYTAYSNDTTGPTLTGTSPVSGDTNIPLNGNATGGTPVVLQFDSPIDPVTAQTGFSVTTGGNAVLGNFSYSVDDRTVTFTPISALTASTTYTVNYTTQITDTTGTPLTNPNSFTFKTGTAADNATPTVTSVDPQINTFGVGVNVAPHVTFSEPVNELTVPGNFNLYYQGFSSVIPATVTVAANRLSATITPSTQLLPSTLYYLYICGYTNIAGNAGSCFESYFYTGNGTDTNATTVTSINPSNGQTGAPINTQVVAAMSDDIDPTSVTNSSITVKQGSTTVAGTVTLAANGTTLTFVPSALLSVSTVYNVTVGGFKDTEGNAVTPFSSSFTTGTGGDGGSFSLVSTSPASGATSVSVTSPVTFTMNNLINSASVTPSTVEVYIYNTNEILAGTYSVSGAAVTFTPLSPYPANTTIGMYIYGLTDEAGTAAYTGAGSFITTNTLDHTAPTVTISPSNGATNVGLNSQVILTFSKSINTSTINQNTLAIFNGDTNIGYGYSISSDNRTIIINQGGSAWPSGATITVELNSGIQDLSGNALANTASQFTVTNALSTATPSVVSMRPGYGATNVPANTLITLFTNSAMNPSSIAGALHVTDNGVVVSGSVQLFSNAQAIVFTPAAAFGAGDLIQVHLDSSAVSASNVPLSAFFSQFTVAGSLASVAATVQATNPFQSATNVPLNSILQIAYNEPLDPTTINSTNVVLYQYSTSSFLTPTLSLVNGGQVINVVPTSNLIAGSSYFLYVSYGGNVKGTNGLNVQAYELNFTAGSAADTAPPTILSQAPTNNATNIATNALVSVNFNKAINPISVTGSTIQLTAGSTTEVPSSISFSPDFTRVSVTPQAPLPPSTVMTYAINGVTSQAGKPVAATTTHFTTAAQPNFTGPYVVSSSVLSSQTNVPVNSAFTMTFNEPLDIGSFNGAYVNVYGPYGANYGAVPATVSWSADQTTVFIVPTSPLNVGSGYTLESYYLTDLSGNAQQNFAVGFTTSFTANTNPPAVINTSPENTQTQVPSNAPVQILFTEPVQPTSLAGITLTTGGNPVAVTMTFSDGNQLLTLRPTQPLLSSSSSFTLTITGVKDTAGNVMVGTVTNTFTTGTTFDFQNPQVILADPVNGTVGVGTNVTPHVQFSKRINPLSVISSSNELYYNGSMQLYDNVSGQWVPSTVGMSSPDRLSATLTPSSPLQPNHSYTLYVPYGQNYYDVAGNYGYGYQTSFVTGSTSDTTHTTISSISPVNNQLGVPQNAHIVAVASDDIDPTTVNNSSITVTPSGGSAIAGTVTLATDGVTLTFVPSAVLNPSTVYNVAVGGFKDTEGNTVTTAFNSQFTTGSGAYSSFSLVSTNPASGASGVSVTSPVTFTMNNLINAASVNPTTVEVYINSTSQLVAGTYNVSGAAVTFTPLSQYPANTVMGMYIYGLLDEAGNAAYTGAGTFTTTNTVDTTAPTVTITPANGSTNNGLNTQVTLTFSKSINPTTITSASVNLLNGDRPINPATSISKDNRTVVLNYNGANLPAGATITVTATSLVTDLSGNALANTTSEFTTTAAVSNATPTVTSMRPGNGATGVPTNAVITLFTSAPMNSSSVTGALEVSQTGVLVSGTTTAASNGQSIQFKPSSALPAGTLIHVNLTSTAQDIYGNFLSNFSGTFTTAADPTTTAATVTGTNPFQSATNVPLNSILQIAYNEQIDTTTLNNTNVVLYQYSTSSFLTPTLSLVGGGQVINVAPTSNLIAGSSYFLYVSYGGNVKGTNGLNVQAYELNFTAGSATDTVAPVITAVAPPDASTNIGTNAGVSVTFNKAINPISVTGSTIQLSGGSVTEVPSSISFTSDNTRTMIIPQAALPGSTSMALAINGVTGEAGVAVASQTTHFMTMAGPDFNAPFVVNASVVSGQTVGTNAAFAMQFNKPMDPGSLNAGGNQWVYLYDNALGYVATNFSFSADMTTVFLTPKAALTASHQFQMCSFYMTDLSGNPQNNFCVSNFFTGSGTQTTGPSVTQVSPPSGFTGVPINAPVQILFSGPISGASLGGVTLKQGGSVVPTTTSLFDGDQAIQLLPTVPLAASTVYTINVTGVKDISGNAQTSFPSQSFTTGTGTDLVAPTLVSTTPANAATNVAVTTTVKVIFNEAMSPASFDPNTSFSLRDPSNNPVPATVTFSSDYKTVTLQPKANLTAATTYYMYVGYSNNVYDLGGNTISTYFYFTTH